VSEPATSSAHDISALTPAERVRLDALRYVANTEVADYIAIMRVFTVGTSGLMADLSAGEVAERLAGEHGVVLDDSTVEDRLSYLTTQGNLARSPRETKARSIEEYLRTRARFQLTSTGELAHRLVEELLGATDSVREVSSALPSWVLLPALYPLWTAAAVAMKRSGRRLPRRFMVRGLDTAARHEVAALLERAAPDPTVSVDAETLDAILRERCGHGLLEVVEAVLGPVPHTAQLAAERAAARDEPIQAALAATGLTDQPWALAWADGVRRLILRHQLTDVELTRALRAALHVRALDGSLLSRVQLSAEIYGDAHALDPGSVAESLVLRGLAATTGEPAPNTAAQRREYWRAYRVSLDLVSSTCLCLGLAPGDGSSVAARLGGAGGDPLHVTAWDLQRSSAVWRAGAPVLVCENPRVLEAVAQEYGGAVAAVCTSGNPGLLAVEVLRRLGRGGATLRYHGDFDWPGVAITNRLVEQVGVQPWLMTASDYTAGTARTGLALEGAPVPPSWDAELGATMVHHGRTGGGRARRGGAGRDPRRAGYLKRTICAAGYAARVEPGPPLSRRDW